MVSRAGTRRCYISLLCVGVLLVVRSKGKYRQRRESVRLRKICASSRTPPSPPRTKDRFEEKDSREMRALLLCVAVHIALLLYKGKKSTFTTTKEKAHVRRKSKRSTPPNFDHHHQTQSLKRYTTKERSRVFFAKENARERDALAPQYSRFRGAKFYLFFTKKSNKKGRGETCLFLIVLHAFRKVYHTY